MDGPCWGGPCRIFAGRNLEYVRAARALGVSDWTIMFRHMLPNAMVATLTMLPFIVTGTIAGLASLTLPSAADNCAVAGRINLASQTKPSGTVVGVHSLFYLCHHACLIGFIFEGVRDAFDPRKTFK